MRKNLPVLISLVLGLLGFLVYGSMLFIERGGIDEDLLPLLMSGLLFVVLVIFIIAFKMGDQP